jgi:hypothetical protein
MASGSAETLGSSLKTNVSPARTVVFDAGTEGTMDT